MSRRVSNLSGVIDVGPPRRQPPPTSALTSWNDPYDGRAPLAGWFGPRAKPLPAHAALEGLRGCPSCVSGLGDPIMTLEALSADDADTLSKTGTVAKTSSPSLLSTIWGGVKDVVSGAGKAAITAKLSPNVVETRVETLVQGSPPDYTKYALYAGAALVVLLIVKR